MATVIEELVAQLGFDYDPADLEKFNQGLEQSKAGMLALGKIVVGTAAAIGAATGFVLFKAAIDEQTLVAFETMLGSAEKARDLFTELRQFADVTPFKTAEVVDAGKKLLAFGVEADDITEKLTNLGNIASGVGADKFDSIILAFGKMRVKGKATMEELNILLEAGVPILDELAKGYGVSNAKLFKMIEAGKVGFKDVDGALARLSNGTGKFAGLMAKQSKTLTGLLSTVQGWLVTLASDIGTELLPDAKAAAQAFLDWLKVNRELVKVKVAAWLKAFFVGAVDVFNTVSDLVGVIGGLENVLIAAAAALGLFALSQIGNIIIGWTVAFNALTAASARATAVSLLLPLLVGAALAAFLIIIDDINDTMSGEDSFLSRLAKDSPVAARALHWLLTPLELIVAAFRAIGEIFAGRSIGEAIEENFGKVQIVRDVADLIKALDFQTRTISPFDAFADDVPAFFGGGGGSVSNSSAVNQENTINIATDNPVAAGEAVGQTLERLASDAARNMATTVR